MQRTWYPNTSYHITARGNRRNDIFKDDEDFQVYLTIIEGTMEYFKNDYEIICYCLMDNHIHILLKTKERHIKDFITRTNSIYAKIFNDKYNYIGHLYQDRYFSEIIENELKIVDEAMNNVLKFTIAVNREYSNDKNEREADFVPVSYWSKSGETLKKYLIKGRLIYVTGRIKIVSYDDKEGVKKYYTEIIADEIQFMDSKKDKAVIIDVAQFLANNNIPVISGMAKGIDGYAHTACLKAGGYTIAILAAGLDICYPKEHESLMRGIIEKGAIVSEYPPGTKPYSSNFPNRNRLISAWCKNLLIIEAGEKSGSLITAAYAKEQKRRVFALPGNIHSKESIGTIN